MVDLIPRNVLFGNPERTAPSMSPDGNSLAWIAPLDGVLTIGMGVSIGYLAQLRGAAIPGETVLGAMTSTISKPALAIRRAAAGPT